MVVTKKPVSRKKSPTGTPSKRRRTSTSTDRYVVTAKFTMKSRPVTAAQKEAIINKVRNSGGTATYKKV